MRRRRFLGTAALMAAGAALGALGCSSNAGQEGSLAGQALDNKSVSDSAAANNLAGGGAKKPRRRTR